MDRLWQEDNAELRKHLVNNIHKLMGVVRDLANILVVQTLGDGKNPAPCFEFYPTNGSTPEEPPVLYDHLNDEISEAHSLGNDDVKEKLDAIIKSLNELPPNPPATESDSE
jgi:hypothetical protein